MPQDKINIYVMKKLYPLPPYNFTYKTIEIIKEIMKEEKIDGIVVDDIGKSFIALSFFSLIHDILDENVNQYMRMMKIDDILMPLVEKTDNEIFYRPLMFPTIFIDNEIWYEDKIVKGVTIVDLEFYREFRLKQSEVLEKKVTIKFKTETEDEKQNYYIFIFMIDKKTYNIDYTFFTLNYDIIPEYKELKQYVRNVVCNIIDMVDAMDESLNVVTIETTKEQNIKRIKRGQIPYPTKIFIKPKEEFKQYVNKFISDMEEGVRKIGYKFLVRGHWRRFRAERYKPETREKMLWIKPYWKGEGIPIAKEYIITK